jgi:hypothetical protein
VNEVVVTPTEEFWSNVVSMLDNANAEFEVVEYDSHLEVPTRIIVESLGIELVLDPELLSDWLEDLRDYSYSRSEAEVFWNE